jgi:hypothetical protein
MLAQLVREAGVDAPALGGLALVIEGRTEAASWAESLTAPKPVAKRPRDVRAA